MANSNSEKDSRPRRLPTYQPPQNGFLSHLPAQWVSYAELVRLAKPVGIMNIYFPYIFGVLYAANNSSPICSPVTVLRNAAFLFLAAFLLRSAGCSWNDIIDRHLDAQVLRCCLRPMARGAISLRNGYIFTAAQTFLWLLVLARTSIAVLPYTIPLIMLVAFYPFAKRLTHYPQVVLGVTLAWGVLIGFESMTPHSHSLTLWDNNSNFNTVVEVNRPGLAALGLSYVLWTIIHDTVYAAQDTIDDIKAGVLSISVRYRHGLKMLLSLLGMLEMTLHVATGWFMDAGLVYYAVTCGGVAAVLITMVWRVDLEQPASCWWWFVNGSLAVGAVVTMGLAGEYVDRL